MSGNIERKGRVIETVNPKLVIMLREQHGFTQMELAERVNVNVRAVRRWETRGTIRRLNRYLLADVLGVPPGTLLADKQRPEHPREIGPIPIMEFKPTRLGEWIADEGDRMLDKDENVVPRREGQNDA